VEDELFEPPPQPAMTRAQRTMDSAATTRDIDSLLTKDFSLSTFTGSIMTEPGIGVNSHPSMRFGKAS